MPRRFVYDAQAAMTFLEHQASFHKREVNEIRYPEIQYSKLMPIDRNIPEWAKSVTYYSIDQTGKAEWVSLIADDIPLADRLLAQHEEAIFSAAIGYGYGYEELQQAIWLAQPLTAQRAAAARRAAEEFIDMKALWGDTSKGWEGLFNNTNVPTDSPITGDWPTATSAKQILADVNYALTSLGGNTLYSVLGDTLVLSDARFDLLATTILDNTDRTLLSIIQDANVYTARTRQPLNIMSARGLDTAGAGDTQRMMAYRNRPDTVVFYLPMAHRFLPVFQTGPLRFIVPGILRIGGVDFKRPLEGIYIDGI